MAEWNNRSLRLCEVLEQEYEHLNKDEEHFAYNETPLIETFKLKNRDNLLAKLKKWLHPENELASIGALTKSESIDPAHVYNPSELSSKKLAQWMQNEQPIGNALQPDDQEALIQKVLLQKLNSDLVTEEPWVLDAPLRPYTKGLLESYVYHRDNRIRSWLFSYEPDDNEGFSWNRITNRRSERLASTRKLLNRMLLEDAFSGDIVHVDDQRLNAIFRKIHDKTQTALCLSGGGIRSGTFALGVVQGLAKMRKSEKHPLLGEFTYLSTVSGGGFLGGWLSAWIYHEGTQNVFRQLNPSGNIPFEPEALPLQHLRRYSNYLSPLLGLFSADTWTLLATYLRNLLLIWLVIIPFLAAIVAVPWVFVNLITARWNSFPLLMGFSVLATVLMIFSDRFVEVYHPQSEDGKPMPEKAQSSKQWNQGKFLWYCLLPGFLSIILWTIAWQWFLQIPYIHPPDWFADFRQYFVFNQSTGLKFPKEGAAVGWIMIGTLIFTGIELVLGAFLELIARQNKSFGRYDASTVNPQKASKDFTGKLKKLAAIFITGIATGPLLLLTATWIPANHSPGMSATLYAWLGVPAFMLAMLFTGVIYTGITSSITDDAEREWDARYSAWFLIVAMSWLAINGIVLFGPSLAEQAIGWVATATTGLMSGYLTAFLGRNEKSAGKGEGAGAKPSGAASQGFMGVLSRITLPIASFITLIILLIVLSYMDMALIRWVSSFSMYPKPALTLIALVNVGPLAPTLVSAGLLVLGLLSAWAIDTNRFSLHAMYRARLIRAYLGASRPPGERRPDPFTGFDEADNIQMGNLMPSTPPVSEDTNRKIERKPFHVIDIALNLVSGQNLAWQERKAESFTVSALHAGSLGLGYRYTYLQESQKRPLPDKNGLYYGGDRGITLGTAMTISGAAVSPNSGYHSSPLVAFFMTLFNARLGWWLGNPGPAGDTTFHCSSPRLAIRPIFNEMIGNTDDTSDYVFLSDGGHFDNLGLYEMVLRRNRFIVVSDASCDEDCTLEDLGNAIRKIRIDLGISIDFPKGFPIHARASVDDHKKSKYWAMGRIRYSEVDCKPHKTKENKLDYDGVLLYIKPEFYGQEPRDIFNYASANKAFPHESTGDQFFSESQFESYRALGEYIMDKSRKELITDFDVHLEELFTKQGLKKCLQKL